jgi:hypothetical protein
MSISIESSTSGYTNSDERGVAAAGRVERRLAHQAVHAGFGAQEAVGVFAFDLQGGGLDAGHLAVGFFHHFDLEAFAFAIAQVLAQQHRGPVLGFGAAGAGLDVDEAVVRVHRIVEHPAEFHAFDDFADFLRRRSIASSVSSSPSSLAMSNRSAMSAGRRRPWSASTTASSDFFSLPRSWAASDRSRRQDLPARRLLVRVSPT